MNEYASNQRFSLPLFSLGVMQPRSKTKTTSCSAKLVSMQKESWMCCLLAPCFSYVHAALPCSRPLLVEQQPRAEEARRANKQSSWNTDQRGRKLFVWVTNKPTVCNHRSFILADTLLGSWLSSQVPVLFWWWCTFLLLVQLRVQSVLRLSWIIASERERAREKGRRANKDAVCRGKFSIPEN